MEKEEKNEEKKVEKEKNIHEKWIDLLAEMPEKLPMTEGYGYKYVPLPAILNTIRPILKKWGFGLSQTWDFNPEIQMVEVTTNIYSGETKYIGDNGLFLSQKSRIPIVKMSNIAQGVGATITYARRYAISSIFGIATDEDTDVTDVEYHRNNKPTKNTKITKQTKTDNRANLPEEMKEKINEIWQKVKEARDLGILDDEIALKQREALKKVSTWSGVEALEKAIYRLIEVEHQRKASQLKEEAKEAINEDFTETNETTEIENDLPL